MASKARPPPFYTTVTYVKEDYIDDAGKATSVDLPLVTLPAGTVLFRNVKIPNPAAGQDIRYFYRDFLGDPLPDGKVCLSPTHNTFFFPFPHVGFGLHNVGTTFTGVEMVVLVNPVNVVACVGPSTFVRGQGAIYTGNAPWQRCSHFSGSDVDCQEPSPQQIEAKKYDNCLDPAYQVRSGTRGWMAIADLDAVNPRTKRRGMGRPPPMNESPMGKYLLELNERIENKGTKLLADLFTDQHNHAGFPEISLYPYKTHKGRSLLTRTCRNDNDAMNLMNREAKQNNLNYLPLAFFTADGMIDMVNGQFSYLGINPGRNTFYPSLARPTIEQRVEVFMEELMLEGIDLPFYGFDKLAFDSRTGFYVLPQIIPKNLKLQIPAPVLQEEAAVAAAGRPTFDTVPYRFLCMPLTTDQERRRVLTYKLLFRTSLPDHFLQKYAIERGFGARRAMIFNRFPVLTIISQGLGLTLPDEFREPLDRAGRLYRKETGKQKKQAAPAVPPEEVAGAAAAAALPLAPIRIPPRTPEAPGTPIYDPLAVSPVARPGTPLYVPGAVTPTAAAEPIRNARTPLYGSTPSPQAQAFGPPRTPLAGGRRQTRGRREGGKGRAPSRLTRRRSHMKKSPEYFASLFSSIWKSHAKVLQG